MNRRLIVAIFAGLFLLFIGFPTLIGIATDWWWFQAIGYQSVFVKQTVAETSLGVGIGAFAFAFFYANLRFAQRGLVPPVLIGVKAQPPRLDLPGLCRGPAWPPT